MARVVRREADRWRRGRAGAVEDGVRTVEVGSTGVAVTKAGEESISEMGS